MSAEEKRTAKWPVKVAILLSLVVVVAWTVTYLTRPVAQVVAASRTKAVRSVPGTVEVKAEFDVELKSEVGGRVKTSVLDVGRKVFKGDVLVTLDSGDVDIEIERIRNDIVAAKRRLEIGSTRRADEQNKHDTLDNLERQTKAGAYPQAEFEKEKRLYQQLVQLRELDEVTLKLAVDTLESQLRAEERKKSKMNIAAPSNGVVTAVIARVGDLIGQNSPIATLISTTRTIEAKLSEDNFAAVQLGQRASVRFLTFGSDQYTATVSKVLPSADPTTQRYAVYLDVELPAGRELMPGLTGEVSIIIAERPNAVVVPRRALVGDFVYVVDRGKVALRKVEKGYDSLNYVEIVKGLNAGEQVVVEQQDRFRSGDRVRAVTAENEAPAGARPAVSTNLRIALRFLTAKRRSMLMSLTGIIFGVGFFVVTQAQTSGFQEFFVRTILGTNGAIRIEDKIQATMFFMPVTGAHAESKFEVQTPREARKYIQGVEEPDEMMAALRRFQNVSGVSTVVEGSVIADSSFKNDTAKAMGIRLQDHLAVSDLESQVERGGGSIDDFRTSPQGLLIGKVLAERLGLTVGDSLILRAGLEQRRYHVSAIFTTGVSDIDRVRIYMHLGEARSLLRKPTGASFIQVALFDRDRAPQDAVQMERVFRHSAKSWQEREESWLQAFQALQISAALTVSTIILISGLGMFNTLAMIVIEKTKEIAILRSMGYTRDDIARIFLWLGTTVLILGTIGGWILGALVTYGVSKYPIKIRGIFSADSFQVHWSIWHYVVATVTAAVVVMTAALIPARRAARLEPGDIIRGTSQ